ncbi:MAG: DUF1289 domain-containing protein [Gallionella sp.]|nr:DUF1289 domain-containing protein [Gallionella sp.]
MLANSVTAESPCIGHCTTVLGDEVCRSCLRTFEEITRWIEMNDEERCAVNRRIAKLVVGNECPPYDH